MLKKDIAGLCMVLMLLCSGSGHAVQEDPIAQASSVAQENPVVKKRQVAKKQPVEKVAASEVTSARNATQAVQPQSGFPVMFAGSKLLVVSNSLTGELTPENRARLIQ